jgi:RNA polymerase sigma-70 factor (ECF subfamily)
MSEEASSQSSDISTLTRQMARGDEMAWREFDRHYFCRLLRYLLVLTGGRQEAAQEALQSTFLRVARHIRPFASEAVFWSWLTVVARTSLVDEQRKRARYFGLLDRFLQRRRMEGPTATEPPGAGAKLDLLELIERNLAALPEEERALLERKYFSRQTVKTIAEETAATEGAIESRLVRIRRKLHDAILAQLNHETTT